MGHTGALEGLPLLNTVVSLTLGTSGIDTSSAKSGFGSRSSDFLPSSEVACAHIGLMLCLIIIRGLHLELVLIKCLKGLSLVLGLVLSLSEVVDELIHLGVFDK